MNLTLQESGLHLHQLDHIRLDLFVDFERSRSRVAHSLVDLVGEIRNPHISMNVEVTDTGECLMSDIEMLDENHYRRFVAVSSGPFSFRLRVDVFEVQLEILLS